MSALHDAAELGVPDLRDVVEALEARYPPETAEPWDAVGLVCGELDQPVRSILWAVDPVADVVDEAIAASVDLVITHHPLFLSGVHSVATTTAKGRSVHRLIQAGIALYAAHTNADVADPGVSDALIAALGVHDATALTASGLGRVGDVVQPMTLSEFADRVDAVLPRTGHGVRVAGDGSTRVQRVAVCGGSGDSLLAAASDSGADVYVTADLKHHRMLDHLEDGGCAVVDVAHWASEWPWLAQAAELLATDLRARGATVTMSVSMTPTDPWAQTLRGSS